MIELTADHYNLLQAESYPLYIAERGLQMEDWIITTLVILEKIQP